MKKVMFIGTTGGHINELLQLEPMFKDYNYSLVTEKDEFTKSLKSKFRNIYYLKYAKQKPFLVYIFWLFINCWISLFIYLRVRPRYIICTGAHASGPMCCIGKIFGSKIIFIESFANSHSKTKTGKIIYHFADLFIVQWESMLKLYPKAVYGGWIF